MSFLPKVENALPGGPDYSVLTFMRKFIPFSHVPWRNGQKDGQGQQLIAVFASPNVDTPFTISLGYVPGHYTQPMNATVAATIYNGSNQGSDWTPNKIVLRSTAAGTFHIEIFP